ncbi:hypothetical protein [Nodosilinea sp. LEGE 07088]|uniref:hypothetical protein n=1 Tax=Nodosilinea sp. LEGE 07088 TaxID=2777968 RepID=UPI0034D95B9D
MEWLHLVEGVYTPLPVEADGMVRSRVFPGLWLAVGDLLNQNMAQVLAVLHDGLQSTDYRHGVQSLTQPSG